MNHAAEIQGRPVGTEQAAAGERRRGRRRLLLRLGAALLLAVLIMLAVAASRARLEAAPPTLLLTDRQGRFLDEIGGGEAEGFGYWPLEKIPPRAAAAVLAVEDRRFWSHPGFDPAAAGRAFLQNLRAGRRVSGASTLAMQVARMQRPGPRTYLRKAVESLTAIFITLRYGREAVLAHYLRIAPFGNRRHGIAYAARRYFDKPVEDLDWAETVFLAALPQAPGRMNPHTPGGRLAAAARGRRILDALLEERAIGEADYSLAVERLERLSVPPEADRPVEALHAILHLDEMLADPETRRRLADRPLVRTSLDLDLQRTALRLVRADLRSWKGRGAGNAAAVILARPSNEVLAWIGSKDYFDGENAGAIDYARVRRSPGSAMKPFIYALALERGVISPAYVLDDIRRAPGGVSNADHAFLGPLLPRAALGNSRNVPAVNLLAKTGLDVCLGRLRELGFGRGAPPGRRYGLGLAIGGMPASLAEMVRAYAALAGDGVLTDLKWFEGQRREKPRRVFTEAAARQITLFLADPMARLPSFPRMGPTEFPFPVAVKTGTSSRYRDAWAMAYTQRYVVGVWVGHPDYRPMKHLGGYASAAVLAGQIVRYLHRDQADGFEDLGFPPPEGHRPVAVCALTGRRATRACDKTFLEWFHPGEEPAEVCRAHVPLTVDKRNGLLATAATPPEFREERTFVDLDPRYAAWAAAEGLPRPPADASPLGPGPRLPEAAPPPEIGRPPAVADLALAGRLFAESLLDETTDIRITSPEAGVRLLRDPETPPALATIALEAAVDPPAEQVVWYVDGRPYKLADYPYSIRWPATPGEHTFQARLPFSEAASPTVRVLVR